jgi:hypothetical protein
MFDAEIAATLLNRWDRNKHAHARSPLELLREGKLHFKREGGEVHAEDSHSATRLRIECITFTDGLRALRITDADDDHGWSQWIAAEPTYKPEISACMGPANVAC